jgi:hypothetical protein
MSSVFFKPQTVEALAQWMQHVGNAAPTLPLYYYHIPEMTGVNFKMINFLKAAERIGVPNLVGIKYTGLYEPSAFPDFEKCTNYAGGRYEVLCGREEMTIEALSIGTRGFIGSQFNFAADLYGAISKAWPSKMIHARNLQALGLELIDIWSGVPAGVNGNRLVMDFTRVSIGSARLPNLLADSTTRNSFFRRVSTWCTKAKRVWGQPPEMCKTPFRTSDLVDLVSDVNTTTGTSHPSRPRPLTDGEDSLLQKKFEVLDDSHGVGEWFEESPSAWTAASALIGVSALGLLGAIAVVLRRRNSASVEAQQLSPSLAEE